MSAEAEVAIRNLLARLAQLADRGEVDGYVESMTEDVVWTMPANDAAGLPASERRGRAEVAAGARERLAAGVQGPGSNTRHVVTTTVVQVASDDHATAESYFLFIDDTAHEPTIRNVGCYEDVLRRTDDGWKLAGRTITFG